MRKIKLEYLAKLSQQAIIKAQYKRNTTSLFNSDIIKTAIKSLNKKKNKFALLNLCVGKINPAIAYLERCKKKNDAIRLTYLFNPQAALDFFGKLTPTDNDKIIITEIHLYNKDTKTAFEYIENIDISKLNHYNKAKHQYLMSEFDIQEGDLSAAAANCMNAINLFRKHKYIYEEAEAYFKLGTIYRISAMSDVAEIMFDTALKIFTNLKFEKRIAETYGNLAMLMVMENRIEQADEYFENALEIFSKIDDKNSIVDIINQKALSALIEKEYNTAENLCKDSFEANHNYLQGEAFCSEIMSHIYSANKKWKDAISHAEKSICLYENCNNIPAILESKFLKANALFETGDMTESEKLLRDIVEISNNNTSCFHTANAYNLLGLIFLKQKNLSRAKTLFQKSVDYENKNNRIDGIAISYANIALIEAKTGNREQATKTINTAIECAKTFGESDLSKLLENLSL